MATKVQDFLRSNPNYVGYANTANRTVTPPKQSGKGGFLSSIISELGGAGGAAAGAATGAALGSVVPGIGNIIGGIAGGVIGGFGGGTAGRLAENKIRDNEYRLGDALKEGAVSGLFGGISPALQGARGLSALGKASGSKGLRAGIGALSELSDDAAKVAGKAIVKSGAKAGKAIGQGVLAADDLAYATRKGLQSTGGRLRAGQRGLVAGNNGLSPSDAQSANRALDSVNKWFSGVGKSSQYTNVDDAMKALSNQYKRAPEAAKIFGSKNADDLFERFVQNINDNPTLRNSLTGKNLRTAESLIDDIASLSKKKNSDFVEYMSSKINPRYRTISSSGNAGSVESQILEAFRDAGKGIIDEKLATRSGVNKQYAKLLKGSEQLGRAITRDTGAGQGQGLSLGRIASDVLGPTADVAGRGMQQIGKVTKITTPLAKGALGRGLVNQATAPIPQDTMQNQTMEQPQDALYGPGAMGGQLADPMSQVGSVPEQPTQSAYSLQQAIADIQAAPDAKTQKAIMDYYDFVSNAEAAQNKTTVGGPNITKVTGQQYVLANRGANAVQQLANLIQNDPNIVNRTATPGRKLPIVGGTISKAMGTGDYDAISYNVANALLRLETGAQANPEEIKNLQTQLMPRAGDSPETIQVKLQQLQEAFSAFLNTANGQDSMYGNSDLSSIIGGM